MISSLSELNKSDNIVKLRECLQYFNTHESETVETAVKAFIEGFWRRRLEDITEQRGIKLYIEKYNRELVPIFEEMKNCKEAKQFTHVLEDSFIGSCRLLIEQFKNRIKKIANLMQGFPLDPLQNAEMLTSIEEFFESMK